MPDPINAVEIAVLVKGIKNITEAAALIDNYAKTVAAAAKVDAVEEAYSRMFKTLDAFLPKREASDAQV